MRRIQKILQNIIVKNAIIRHIEFEYCMTNSQVKESIRNYTKDSNYRQEKWFTRVCEAYKKVMQDDRSIIDISIFLLEEVTE
jgi:hypothetical protein